MGYCQNCGLELYEEHEQEEGICDDCRKMLGMDDDDSED